MNTVSRMNVKSDKPAIVIIENSIGPTGSLYSILRSSSSLKDSFEFVFVLPSNSNSAMAASASGVQVRHIPMKELRRNALSMVGYIPWLIVNVLHLRKLLKRSGASLIVNNDFYNLLPAIACWMGSTVPYVCYVRFLPSKFPKLLVKLWYGLHAKYARRIIAVSEAVKRELPGAEKNVVIYNELPDIPVDFNKSASTLILFPANYITGKGQDLALEAFARISGLYPDWILRFVGGDMGLEKNNIFKQLLINRADELGLSKEVQFLDFSTNLSEHYQQAAFTLNFSESESFSLTTLEAQFYGRAVIVTRCGGPEEIIVDGETGILVPLSDVEAMSKAIEYLIVNPDIRNRMGEKGYHHVRQKFSYDNTIAKLGGLYQQEIDASIR